MSSFNSSMDDLPPNVMLDILSRLPVKTIIHCKCVCKKWQNIVLDSYFANYHLSRSPKGLMIQHDYEERMGLTKPNVLKWVEIEDEPDYHRLHHDPVMCLDLNLAPVFQKAQLLQVGSVNGLICLWEFGPTGDNTYICNPITREYMILPRQQYYREGYATIVYGFGAGLHTNDYKVIRTFEGDIPPDQTSLSRPSLLEAEVYTLGTGQWRSLGHIPYLLMGYFGPLLNGHVHWIVVDQDSPEKLCAFDFDSETFKLFPSPPCDQPIGESWTHFSSLGVLNGCLAQSETFDEAQFTIWVMKDYGIKKSWHREMMIKKSISPDLDWIMWQPIHLLEGLKDGTILMVYWDDNLLAYNPQTKTIEDTKIFERYLFGMTYRPGFLRLRNFKLESVHMF